jgi:glycosyltransferase involved in cell wall biosynthesis
MQIVVVDGSQDDTAGVVAQQFPNLRLIQKSFPCSLPHLLGAGLVEAQGDIVAITEAHCVFPPDWARAVIAAHEQESVSVIGGVVEPGPELGWSDWALYFADYGQFMKPLRSGVAQEIPGENVSFKSSVLKAAQHAGANFERDGFWKTFFCRRLQQTGQPLVSVPDIVVFYNRRMSLTATVTRRLRHGRCFGGMRARQSSVGRRSMVAIGGGLLPVLIFVRLWRNVWPKRRYRREFIVSLPLSLTAVLAWSVGEWWGTLFGTGNACDYV